MDGAPHPLFHDVGYFPMNLDTWKAEFSDSHLSHEVGLANVELVMHACRRIPGIDDLGMQ